MTAADSSHLMTTTRSLGRRLVMVLAAFILAGGVLASPSAHAEDREKALQLFNKAKTLHEEGKNQEAVDALREALKNFDNDGIRLTMVNRYLDLGQPEDAAAVLSQVTDKKMRKMVKKLRGQIEDLLAKPVTVKLSAEPAGTQVSIDSSDWQRLPLTLDLPRGKHRFTFKAKGRKKKEIVKVLKGVKTVPIFVSLGAPPGSWRVQLEPSGDLKDVRIIFNGKQVNLSAEERLKSLSLPRKQQPGRFKVQCLKGIDDFAAATIDIVSGKEAIAICKFAGGEGEGIGEMNLILGGVMAGVFAAGIATGVGLFVSYEQDLADFPPPRYEVSSSKPAIGGVAIGLGVVAGVMSALFFAEVIDLGGDEDSE